MAPIALEPEDHSRDAAFNSALHGKSATRRGGFGSMFNKDRDAHKAASEEYFKHWDNKSAGTETAEIREVSCLVQIMRSQSVSNTLARHGKQNMQHSQDTTTTLPQIFTSMAGEAHSISADLHTVKDFTKPLPVMSITWRTP